MKKINYFIIILWLIIFSACENEDKTISDYFSSITAKVQDDNALRVDIDIAFQQEVKYQIEYWEVGNDTKSVKTKVKDGRGLSTCTLVLLKPETTYAFRIWIQNDFHMVSETYQFTTKELPSEIPTCYV